MSLKRGGCACVEEEVVPGLRSQEEETPGTPSPPRRRLLDHGLLRQQTVPSCPLRCCWTPGKLAELSSALVSPRRPRRQQPAVFLLKFSCRLRNCLSVLLACCLSITLVSVRGCVDCGLHRVIMCADVWFGTEEGKVILSMLKGPFKMDR